MEFAIRKVELADAETLLALSRKTFFDAFYHLNTPADMEAYAVKNFVIEKLGAELHTPGARFFFALDGDTPTGYIKLNRGAAQSDLQEETSIEVERIYVDANYQNYGIGHKLMDFALQTAVDEGMESIWLGVWEHNSNAIRFYERHGFFRFASHQFMLGSDEQTDVLMRKMLVK